MWTENKVLRVAFLIGVITDALAILPMLVPPLAYLLWGFENVSGAYKFAMGYGASLMLGWTALLIWAYRKPVERKAVAALTVIVVWGLVFTEIMAVFSGYLSVWRMLPTWFLQAIIISLFAWGFHYSKLRQLHERFA